MLKKYHTHKTHIYDEEEAKQGVSFSRVIYVYLWSFDLNTINERNIAMIASDVATAVLVKKSLIFIGVM